MALKSGLAVILESFHNFFKIIFKSMQNMSSSDFYKYIDLNFMGNKIKLQEKNLKMMLCSQTSFAIRI